MRLPGIILAVLTLLASDAIAATMTILDDPYALSGRVAIRFQGTLPVNCGPMLPGYVVFDENAIDVFLNYPTSFVSCDFSTGTFDVKLEQLNIPVQTALQSGVVTIRGYLAAFPPATLIEQQDVEISFGRFKERYFSLVFENGGLALIRRSDYSLFKRLPGNRNTDIYTSNGQSFSRITGYSSSNSVSRSIQYIDPALLEPNAGVLDFHSHMAPGVGIIDILDLSGVTNNHRSATAVLLDWVYRDNRYFSLELATDADYLFANFASRPHSLAENPTRASLYVSIPEAGEVQELRLTDLTELQTLNVGTRPELMHASPDGNKIAINLAGDQQIAILDANSNTIVSTFPFSPLIQDIIHDPLLPYFYIWDSAGNLYTLNHQTSQLSQQLHVGGELAGFSLNPDGGEIFSFSRVGARTRIDVFDTENFQLQETAMIDGRVVDVPEFISVEYWVNRLGSPYTPIPMMSKWGTALMFLLLLLLAATKLRWR